MTVWQPFKRSVHWLLQSRNLASSLPIVLGAGLAVAFKDEGFVLLTGATCVILLPKCKQIGHALAAGFTLLLLFYLLSAIKRYLLDQPLFLFDLYYLQDNILVLAANDWRVFGGLALLAMMATALLVAYIRKPVQRWTRERQLTLLTVAMLSLLAGTYTAHKNVNIFRINKGYPSVAVFLESARIAGYTFDPAPKARRTLSHPASPPVIAAPEPKPLPHLVFVLQESTISPAQLTLPVPYEPKHLFAHSARSKVGTLTVNTFGGATWLSVFSLIYQFRPDQMGQNHYFVTFQLTGQLRRSLFTLLQSKGYATQVIYSVPGTFINAKRFLLSNGLERFDDPASAGIGSGWDWETPDEAFLEIALDRLKSDQPQAILVLTIAQHGPHDLIDPLADYLSRFAASDQAHGHFVDAVFARSNRPVVIATFGDHQPWLMEDIRNAPPRYQTSFQIECYPEQTCDYSRLPDHIDLTLLATYVFEAAGLNKDVLMYLQKELYEDCIGDILGCGEDSMAVFNGYLAQKILR